MIRVLRLIRLRFFTPKVRFSDRPYEFAPIWWADDDNDKFNLAYLVLKAEKLESSDAWRALSTSLNLQNGDGRVPKMREFLDCMGEEGEDWALRDIKDPIFNILLVKSDDWQVHAKLMELDLKIFSILARGPNTRK